MERWYSYSFEKRIINQKLIKARKCVYFWAPKNPIRFIHFSFFSYQISKWFFSQFNDWLERQRGEKCGIFYRSTRCAHLLHCRRLKRVRTDLNRRHLPVADWSFGNRSAIWCIAVCGSSTRTNLCHWRSPNEKRHLVSIRQQRSKTHRCWLWGMLIQSR